MCQVLCPEVYIIITFSSYDDCFVRDITTPFHNDKIEADKNLRVHIASKQWNRDLISDRSLPPGAPVLYNFLALTVGKACDLLLT